MSSVSVAGTNREAFLREASDPATTPERLRFLALNASGDVKDAVLSNPAITGEVLTAMCSDGNPYRRLSVMRHPRLPDATLRERAGLDDPEDMRPTLEGVQDTARIVCEWGAAPAVDNQGTAIELLIARVARRCGLSHDNPDAWVALVSHDDWSAFTADSPEIGLILAVHPNP